MSKSKKKFKIGREDDHKIRVQALREDRLEDGAFDGRFNTKVQKAKKSEYKRREKHRNNYYD
jgi:hypothetical protein